MEATRLVPGKLYRIEFFGGSGSVGFWKFNSFVHIDVGIGGIVMFLGDLEDHHGHMRHSFLLPNGTIGWRAHNIELEHKVFVKCNNSSK